MNTFSGKGGFGLVAAFTVLLMPLLGTGTAFAMGVGDTVTLQVPDLQQFLNSAGLEERVFTCRAVTEHAVWLVQDSSWVGYFGSNKVDKDPENPTPDRFRREEPKIVWGTGDTLNMVKPDEFTALTQAFENEVWSTVTGFCGAPTDVDGDGKVYVVLASIPTIWSPEPKARAVRGNMYCADPEFYEVNGNAAEVFFLNIHPYSTDISWAAKREEFRQWNLADGFASLCMLSKEHDEDAWLVRAIAGVMQYECFGFTKVAFGPLIKRGMANMLSALGKESYRPLFNTAACAPQQDFQAARAQGFMWIMYLRQLYGEDAVTGMIQDTENAGMLSVARLIDSSATEDNAVEVITPVYNDFQMASLCSDLHSDMNDGRYQFSFLVGTTEEGWSIAATPGLAGMTVKARAGEYPLGDLVGEVKNSMADRVLCSQFVALEDFDQAASDTVYLNCQYTTGSGSNGAVLSHWDAWSVFRNSTTGELLSVQPIEFDDNYNALIVGEGTDVYMVLTNADEECPPNLRYYVSQNTEIPAVESALHQNPLAPRFLTFYTTLFSAVEDDYAIFDWYGPVFTATLGDSVQNIKMKTFANDLYSAEFSAWTAGDYKLEIAGFTPAGFNIHSQVNLATGFVDNGLTLEIPEAMLSVSSGGAATGSMVMLYDCGALDFSIENSMSIVEARGQMTGIVAGPVQITDVTGVLSFESAANTPVVYRYSEGVWTPLPSSRQNGRTSAVVDEGGIYALGEGIGTYSPELPNQMLLNGNAPNPFSAQTEINFSLPVSGNVVVRVFDMTGRLVATVANEEMLAANHSIIWDGTDSSGVQVGAGVYFCRLEAAGQVLTQKMLKVQ